LNVKYLKNLILGYIAAFTMSIILDNLDSTRKLIVSVNLIILHGGIVSTILRLHIVRGQEEITPKLYIHVSQQNEFLGCLNKAEKYN